MLCQHYGLTMNQVMAFGNEGNDLEMLNEAGIGVAMGNAPKYVQQSADIITKSNDDEGIVRVLDKLV
jgi:hydroxymethylpyrimidine pyrophosphatase-like HAD family hydrolase